jgi:uncharacterized membrane protein
VLKMEIKIMSQKNSSKTNRNKSKKAAILDQPKRRFQPWALAVVCLVMAAALTTGFLVTRDKTDAKASAIQAVADRSTSSSDAVQYPVSLFDDGAAHFFKHQANGIEVRYFILKSSDGILRAAFDACDVCWPAGRGYKQVGDDMVCQNCGRRFASVRINEVQGGCNPAPLQRTLQGDRLIIAYADILTGQTYFNFSKRT